MREKAIQKNYGNLFCLFQTNTLKIQYLKSFDFEELGDILDQLSKDFVKIGKKIANNANSASSNQ